MSFGDKPDWQRRAQEAERQLDTLASRLAECAVSTVAITPAEAERLIHSLGWRLPYAERRVPRG